MGIRLLDNGIPHDAIILTNSAHLEEFMPAKALAIPSESLSGFPWEIEIHLTGWCNLSCRGCSYSARHSNSSLSAEDIENIFRSVKQMGSHTLFFSGGGDPIHWANWSELIRLKMEIIPGVFTGISTNLISDYDCRFINSFFDIIQVHVVGYDSNSCKSNTNVDCFELMNRNLALLNNNNTVFKVLVNSENYTYVGKYLSFLSNFVAKTIVLKFEQNYSANQVVCNNRMFEESLRIVNSHNIISKYKHVFSTQSDGQLLVMPSKCHVVDKHLYCLIRENGDVFPCIASTYSPENSIGNIRHESLEKIYKNNIDSGFFSENMIAKKCPLAACRHFRVNQAFEKENGIEKLSYGYIPSLL